MHDANVERLIAHRAEIATYLAIPPEQRTVDDAPVIRAEDHAALLDVVLGLVRRLS